MNEREKMTKKIVLGYIGNGKSANRYHIPFVQQRSEKFIIKKIFDVKVRHDIWKRIDCVEYTENLQDILNDSEINLVVVCTAPHLHYSYTKMILEHNKNCLVEKPFMETSEQAKEIFELANEKGLFCSAYQNRRYDSDFLTVQSVIESRKLGDIFEVEMHFDYYRPEKPNSVSEFNPTLSFLYGHGCHAIDQVISYFGEPDRIYYDVRQLLGSGRMNDYYDLDFYYNKLKVSVKSSYFRIKARPSFVIYGTKGIYVKDKKDKQEEDLKRFYMPDNNDFGMDNPIDYGTITYVDENGNHEEKVKSKKGDYGKVYDGIYDCIINHLPQVITHEQILFQLQVLETGVKDLR